MTFGTADLASYISLQNFVAAEFARPKMQLVRKAGGHYPCTQFRPIPPLGSKKQVFHELNLILVPPCCGAHLR